MTTNLFIMFRSICTLNEINKQTIKIGADQMMMT